MLLVLYKQLFEIMLCFTFKYTINKVMYYQGKIKSKALPTASVQNMTDFPLSLF